MQWGRKWGNFWGRDQLDPIEIVDYEELPPTAYVSWSPVNDGDNVIYHVFADGKYYDSTTKTEMVVQFIDYGRHWIEIFLGGPGSMDEDISAFVTSIPGTRVKLSWSASASTDLDHYAIYQKIAGVWTGLGITKSSETEYITGVLSDGTYEFKVNPVDHAGNETESLKTISITLSHYPEGPTSLELSSFNPLTEIAQFSFSPSVTAGVTEYRVYHNSGSGSIDYNTVRATVLAGSTTFNLLNLGSGDWKVGIRAYNGTYEEDNVDVYVSFSLGGSVLDLLEDRPNVPNAFSCVPIADGKFRFFCTYEAFDELSKGTNVYFYTEDGLKVGEADIKDHETGEQAIIDIETDSTKSFINSQSYDFYCVAVTNNGRKSEKSNTATGTADSQAPNDIDSLTAEAINYEESEELPT